MTTYARIVNGFAVDVVVTPPELVDRFHPEWLARQTFVVVPDGTEHGAKDNGNGTFTNYVPPPPPPPQPNNPGNPYFGKTPLEAHQFRALAGQVLGPKYSRLRNDPAFLWIQDMLDSPTFRLVDPDDKDGQFLKIINYLENTNAADGQPLMSAADVAAVMGAWK